VESAARIVATPDPLVVRPSESALIAFTLINEHDVPLADRIIQFAIVDDPRTVLDEARGSTLSFDRGVTDTAGLATLQVIAGPQPTTFRLRASAPRATDAEVAVIVTPVPHAQVELAPVLTDGAPPGRQITTVRLHLLDQITCAEIDYQALPPDAPPPKTIAVDTILLYSAVSTGMDHAAVAFGLDATDKVRAAGCVDLPGSLLVVESPVRVVLPLHMLQLSPAGRYAASSFVLFRTPPAAAMQITAAWGDLDQCPMDPARLWLDCALDALHTDASDPSDCLPSSDEGPLGTKLVQRRGVPLPVPASGRCRDRVDGAGRPSLEVLVDGLFPAQRPTILTSLSTLAVEALHLLDNLELGSTLIIAPTSSPGRYQIEHRLRSIQFQFSLSLRPSVVDLALMGAPIITARFVAGTTRGNDLAVGSHGFTLRLGTAAWLAFAEASLRPRGGGGDVDTFSNALFGLATRDEGGARLSGCPALDAVICPDLGEPRGCLLAACTDGLAALSRRLGAGFAALDGDDLDLVLGGSVTVLDENGDGKVDSLGVRNGAAGSSPGLWSGEIRGRGGPIGFSGPWTATAAAP
jgi:hypothetical protein